MRWPVISAGFQVRAVGERGEVGENGTGRLEELKVDLVVQPEKDLENTGDVGSVVLEVVLEGRDVGGFVAVVFAGNGEMAIGWGRLGGGERSVGWRVEEAIDGIGDNIRPRGLGTGEVVADFARLEARNGGTICGQRWAEG